MINKIKIDLIKSIDENPDISLEEICKLKNLKYRTFYNQIKEINDFLEENKLNTITNNNSKFSINLDFVKFNSLINKSYYLFSHKERIDFICFDIVVFKSNKNLQDYSDFFSVSKSTITSDFLSIKKNLDKFSLKLVFSKNQGYEIIGEELSIRNLIINYINIYANNDDYLFLRQMFDYGIWENKRILLLILEFEKSLNKKFTSSYFLFLKRYLSVLSVYYKKNKFLKILESDKEIIKGTKELEFAFKIAENLIENIDDEVYYIAILLLAGNVVAHYQDNLFLVNLCKTGLVKMINAIEQNNYLFFSNKEQLISDIINHLVPTYYRLKFHLKVGYEYINSIKTKYKDFYLITKKNIKYLEEHLNIVFNEDEILLISLYVVSNLLSSIDTIRKIRAVIVSNEGFNISRILKLEIERTFLNLDVISVLPLSDFLNYKKSYDLILSLVNLPNHNFIKIKNIITNSDRKKINKWILDFFNQEDIQLIKIKNILKDNYIQIFDGNFSWKESIELSSQPLLDKKDIERSYIDAMINNIEKYKACIILNEGIAMPHASFKDGVNKLGFTFNLFKKPVIFPGVKKSYKISLIIVLAPADNEKHIKPMLELIECLQNNNNVKKILKSQSTKHIYEIISKV